MTVSISEFLELATAARVAEQKGYWEKAQELWEAASEVARKPCNKDWAKIRAQFCASRKYT